MSNDEYRELIDFLGVKFGRLEQRISSLEERLEDRMTRGEITTEGLRGDIRLVAEGVTTNARRLDRIETRLGRVESKVDGLDVRVGALEVAVRDMASDFGARLSRLEVA